MRACVRRTASAQAVFDRWLHFAFGGPTWQRYEQHIERMARRADMAFLLSAQRGPQPLDRERAILRRILSFTRPPGMLPVVRQTRVGFLDPTTHQSHLETQRLGFCPIGAAQRPGAAATGAAVDGDDTLFLSRGERGLLPAGVQWQEGHDPVAAARERRLIVSVLLFNLLQQGVGLRVALRHLLPQLLESIGRGRGGRRAEDLRCCAAVLHGLAVFVGQHRGDGATVGTMDAPRRDAAQAVVEAISALRRAKQRAEQDGAAQFGTSIEEFALHAAAAEVCSWACWDAEWPRQSTFNPFEVEE